MPLTNTQLCYYDSNVLRLPADKRKQYHAQVDHLVSELSKTIRDKTKIKVTRVVKAGSFAKHTILRRTANDPVDVDVVLFISGRDIDNETLQGLNDAIFDLLVSTYPTKKVSDFTLQRKAATVSFIGSGLDVDLVPVIEDPSRAGYGWQFDRIDGSRLETCATCQIQFVRDRKEVDKNYRTLVRMAKRWRNHAELFHLKSFAIELLMAHVLDTQGVVSSIEEGFRRFLLYIAQSELKETISFRENTFPLGTFNDPVVVIDPVYSLNNVTARMTDDERKEIVAEARGAWEIAHEASADDDIDAWKEIFGPRFKVEED